MKLGVPSEVVSAVPPGVFTTMGPWLLGGLQRLPEFAESDLITA